jgi:acyl carrier protein
MATIFERLQKITAEQLGVDKESITPTAIFVDDLNADPADLAELMAYIEKEFSTPKRKIEISDEEIDKIINIQDVIELLRDHAVEDEE